MTIKVEVIVPPIAAIFEGPPYECTLDDALGRTVRDAAEMQSRVERAVRAAAAELKGTELAAELAVAAGGRTSAWSRVMDALGVVSPSVDLATAGAFFVGVIGERVTWASAPSDALHQRILLTHLATVPTAADLVRQTLERLRGLADGLGHALVRNTIGPGLPDGPTDEGARSQLATATESWARTVLHSLTAQDDKHEAPGAEAEPRLRKAYLASLEAIGEKGRRAAKEARKAAVLWFSTPLGLCGLPWLELAASALWTDRVKPQIERERKNPPALVVQVHEDVTRIHSRAFVLEEQSGQRALVYPDTAPIVVAPTLADTAIVELVNRGARLLGSVNAHRALRHEIVEAHRRAFSGEPDPRVLRFDGWGAFAKAVGARSKKAPEELRAIVHAQSAVRLTLPDGGSSGLVLLRDSPGQGRRAGIVEITVGTFLMPHYVHELGEHYKGRALGEAKRLVPLVATLPPMVGREREHGAQATLSMLLVRELRVRARELVAEGGVLLDDDTVRRLARQASLPVDLAPRVLEAWTHDGDDAPAFLEHTGGGRYTLGRAHGPTKAFLVEAGHRESVASEAGKRSALAREQKRRRLNRGVS